MLKQHSVKLIQLASNGCRFSELSEELRFEARSSFKKEERNKRVPSNKISFLERKMELKRLVGKV